MKRIAITTLGCKINQFESASFQSEFELRGCALVAFGQPADVIVINTCTVTGKAGAQSRQLIRKAARTSPGAKIVITGCHAQMAAQELIDMEELRDSQVCIVGNGNKHLLVDTALQEKSCDLSMLMGKILRKTEICPLPVRRFNDRTRAFLRVQDGCNSYCTYCIVPYTRGPSRSLAAGEVLRQAEIFAGEGHKEIVVTGIHTGMYGRDLKEGKDIAALLQELCAATPGVRYRLSSIEPLEIQPELLRLMAERSNFMPHLHIPLQSGDDEILSRMNRRYRTSDFAAIVNTCLRDIPDAAIGIDVLVGFPGETERHFANTESFLRDLACTYLHVFPYSKRPGTVASTLKEQVAKAVKDERVARLRALGEQKKAAFYSRHLGTRRQVLVEGKRDSKGMLKGFTDNYIPVCLPGDETMINTLVLVELQEISDTNVIGKHIQGCNES
ncbi:MAG: tRNA (N(6)-L-threonylcarbamoyladenosine(37)-C(2))-methylthiotransferase MtaB [Desulfocapsaceae bacterium]|nr:tRNA (N(6)-L-threonylcarbamoyladenosine(37)-C(2))-methylthiotransferase MtaB [Desulfocapsaceae bacterium]